MKTPAELTRMAYNAPPTAAGIVRFHSLLWRVGRELQPKEAYPARHLAKAIRWAGIREAKRSKST